MRNTLAGLLLILAITPAAGASEPGCSLHQPNLSVPRADIFTEQQEQWLGEAQADMIEPRYTLLPESENSYLDKIGKRLLDQLPPTAIHYTFHVFQSADLRAFSLAGGHIYISRKLIVDARSEDELAAMLAQEIGRVYIHHSASVVTRRLDKLMHERALGDRQDVYNKFERLLNVPTTDASELTAKDQEQDELLADQVGIYAMVKAGYTPAAFATFLDRVNNNGGFTGTFLTDLFDATPEISVRVRTAERTIKSLPAACRVARPAYQPDFKPFQYALSQQEIDPIVPETPGLNSVPLKPPLNQALENVVISPDGKYVLAQDEFKIHVLTTTPFQFRFSINALDAEMAQFTPDSSQLVFNNGDLHIEKWDLDSGQPADRFEFGDYAGCVQTSLSPDGNVMACVSYYGDSVWLKLVDVNTFNVLYQNLHFYDHSLGVTNTNVPERSNSNFQALMRWSRDGRYFVAASGISAMAYDLKLRRTVPLEQALSSLSQERFAFVGSDKLVSTCDWSFKSGSASDAYNMCYTTFPGGQKLGNFQLPRGWLAGVASGDRLLFGPTMNAGAVVLDPSTGRIQGEFKQEAVDLAGDEMAAETPEGGVAFGPFGSQGKELNLPVSPLSMPEASAFSADGRYLAISNRARGAEWDLSTGKRIAATPAFRAVAINDKGDLLTEFIHHELTPSRDPSVDRRSHKFVYGLTSLGDPTQYGSIRIRFKPRGVLKAIDRDVDMEAYDAQSEAHLWSIHFESDLPEIVQADGDQLLFVMDLQDATADGEASRNRKALLRTADQPKQLFGNYGTLVEVISGRTGSATYAFKTPQQASWRREERTAALFGNLLAVYGNNNDTVVYRVSDGARLMAFFGRALAGDPGLGLIAATNRAQELSIFDCANGKLLASYTLDHNVLAARFVPEEKELLVLTATQRVYRIELTGLLHAH